MKDEFAGKDTHVKKDVALEALRGLAAFVVVFWHFLLGYAPGHVPIFPGMDQSQSILGQPWFGLVYGTSSVTFFFVLSGFVLSRKAILNGDAMILARGAVKRWPRLAAPVAIAVLFSWLLFATHSYRYAEAGAITHSTWLSTFELSIIGANFRPNFFKALNEGASLTFLEGKASYDVSLWTMHIEFIGSFIVFGLGAILVALRQAKPIVLAWILIVVLLICGYVHAFYVCFVAGVALAVIFGQRKREIPLWLGGLLSFFAVWLMGYYPTAGFYNSLIHLIHFGPGETYVHMLGALIAIFVIETTPRLRRLLSGRISVVLGRLSFPVYLFHGPVLCSAGAAAFLATQNILPGIGPKLAALVTTLIVTILLAWPLALFDGWWVRKVGFWTDRLVPRPQQAQLPAETPYTIH